MSDTAGVLDPRADAPLPHYVDAAPFDPEVKAPLTAEQKRYYTASARQLIWWKFRRHKLAVASLVFLAIAYLAALLAEFVAPYPLTKRDIGHILAPPQAVHLFHEGRLIGPFVYDFDMALDMERMQRIYTPRTDTPQPLRFFCRSDWDGELRLVCPQPGSTMFLFGTDRLGRDMLSRIIYGTRISLTVGLLGIAISLVLGIVIGGIAGYYGGWIDSVTQRVIEIVRSFPELPLWMALSAALPVTWSPVLVFFGITVILGLLDWTGLARAVRSKFLSLREEDFVSAAKLMGASPGRVIGRHMLPNFYSHIIASATLSIPGMILGETALSFLGLGLRPPVTSWGVLLHEAQNISAVTITPWLLLPVLPVILTVLAFSFLGDGLRDAADPYR